MRRTPIAIALATGALAIPGYALASGGDDPASTTTTPVQQDQQQQPPRDRDCPEGQDGGASSEQTQL